MSAGYSHLQVRPISWQKGHHINAAVAYHHGTRTTSMGTATAYRHTHKHGSGEDVFDFRGKIGVTWFGIVARTRQAVDALETRSNARLAQEIVIVLPHQVGLDDHIAMLTAFAERTAVVLMAYGTPRSRDEILPYYTDIRRGRPPTDEALASLASLRRAIRSYWAMERRRRSRAFPLSRPVISALRRRTPPAMPDRQGAVFQVVEFATS